MRIKRSHSRAAATRLCALAAFGALTVGSVGLAAPASATTVPETGSAPTTMLGWSERTVASHDEWRGDFTVRVKAGTVPSKIEWNRTHSAPTTWTALTKVASIQASVASVYSIVQTVQDGDEDVLSISARGDSIVSTVAQSTTYQVGIRITMADGTTTTRHAVENVSRNTSTGRPVPIQAWGTTTSPLPGYYGPNSETGWGNVVAADSSESLLGVKFHVDAINSGRSATNGCDVTDSLYYQFVRGDDGTPASITPIPQLMSIANHPSGVKGAVLVNEGRFSLDAPGYYKLVIWPQASSSKATAPQDCTGVSYDPAVPSESTQVGSVFWKMPTTFAQPEPVTPVTVATPAGSEVVSTPKPVFSGTGHPGATVEVKAEDGTLHGSALVDADGQWSVEAANDHADGDYSATVTQTAGSDVSSASVAYSVSTVKPVAAVSLASPADGETVTVARPVFSGTGHPGASVVVRGSSGKVLAIATVDATGAWSATSTLDLGTGSYVGVVEHTFGESSSTAPLRYSVALTPDVPAMPFAVTSPAVDGTLASTMPIFRGTGTPGATVEVRGNSGRVIASAVVDASGNWLAQSTVELASGQYLGSVHHSIGGALTVNPISYRIAYGLTMTSPVAGGTVSGPIPTFRGTGEAGATVLVRGSSGRTVATTTVGADGTWSADALFELSTGGYVGSVVQIIDRVETHTAPISYTVS
ncbi:Ig-like domain-containing protein [Leifsonia sp. Le1]|uniref:Ig-like domain-containing protein n=1 Tax=Leifsonia sp. Le1 TaxID=3404918 RepID=UPI003EB97EF0